MTRFHTSRISHVKQFLILSALLGVLGMTCQDTFAQNDKSRRDYFSPGILLDTGGRTGACDVLRFTDNGQHLLACGDDKVVRNWKFTGKALHESNLPTLRWKIWQRERGHIYAMDLSPDKENRLVAVAGNGVKNSQAAVIDRFTGEIKYGLWEMVKGQDTTWAIAFSPNAKQVCLGCEGGTVWAWDLKDNRKHTARLIGKHGTDPKKRNKILFVRYTGNEEVVAVDRSGSVHQWSTATEKPQGKELFRFPKEYGYSQAVASTNPGRKWLAVAAESSRIFLRSFPDGNINKGEIRLPKWHYPNRIAFDAAGKRLAVGVRVVDANAGFFREKTPKIFIYDISGQETRLIQQFQGEYRIEGLAFHPGGNFLALAGGDNHEVRLWDIRENQPQLVSEQSGVGKCIWQIALSKDDPSVFAFKDKRELQTPHPNQRGTGPWKVFDLKRRIWKSSPRFRPLAQHQTWKGWKVLTQYKDVQRADTWFVQGPDNKVWHLDHNPARYGFPQCYTFLPPKDGYPLRVVIGHYYGASVFEFPTPGHLRKGNGPADSISVLPSRIMAGQEGAVMALAVSEDQKVMITGSRDQTIAGWSMLDWPSQEELGASFLIENKDLLVNRLDAGSPAWEAGLKVKDKIALLQTPTKIVYRRFGKGFKDIGTLQQAKQVLQQPVPGQALYFAWTRPGQTGYSFQFTSVRQRPIWQFFPAGQEWTLWRHRDHYYDCSTNGDFFLGFQENGPTVFETPVFVHAEQMRESHHKPKKLMELFKHDGEFSPFPDIAPPKDLSVTPKANFTLENGERFIRTKTNVTVHLSAQARRFGNAVKPNDKLTQAILWVNDYKFKSWPINGNAFEKDITIPHGILRTGNNEVMLQCYNQGGVRGESQPIRIRNETKAEKPTLNAVVIGVGDYRKSIPRQNDLKANADAQGIVELLRAQKTDLYQKINILPPLLDGAVTRSNVLKQLSSLKGTVKPDDVLIVHIGGHGARPADLRRHVANRSQALSKSTGSGVEKRDAKLEAEIVSLRNSAKLLKGVDGFFFCCSDFDLKRLPETTINFDDIYSVLVDLPCHKVIFLDTCHSGEVDVYDTQHNIVRSLTPDGMGPVIVAACRPDQNAWEHPMVDPKMFGVFTGALRSTMQERFSRADKDKNGILSPVELFDNTRSQVLRTMQLLDRDQEPIAFMPKSERSLPLLKK